jgi:hypothetical protein
MAFNMMQAMEGLLCKFHPTVESIGLLVQHVERVQSTVEDTDGIIEIEIVEEAYEPPLVVLFREGRTRVRWGIRLDESARGERSWWEQRGFKPIRGTTYIDPETYEEKTVDGPPVLFPVQFAEMAALLLEIVSDFLKLPQEQELIATAVSNPDDWPLQIPWIAPPDGVA